MKRNFTLLLMIFVCSLSFFFGCKGTYDNLEIKLSYSDVITLYVPTSTETSNSQIVITSTATGVKKKKNIQTEFVLESGNCVVINTEEMQQNVTRAVITAHSIGTSYIRVVAEGDVQKRLKVVVANRINDVQFTQNQIAVRESGEVDLNRHLTFNEGTDQTNVKFQIMNRYGIYVDTITGDDIEYISMSGGVIAVKEGFMAYASSLDVTNESDLLWAKLSYENNITNDYTAYKNFVSYYCLRVKAVSTVNEQIQSDDIIVPILKLIDESNLAFLSEKDSVDDTTFEILPDANGEYNLILGTRDYTGTAKDFATMRDVIMRVSADSSENSKYSVTTSYMRESSSGIASIESYGDSLLHKFRIKGLEAGTSRIKVTIDYIGFEGQFTIEKYINVTVKDFPSSVYVNNQEVTAKEVTDTDLQNYYIYDLYDENNSVSNLGTPFKISGVPAGTDFSYTFEILDVNYTNYTQMKVGVNTGTLGAPVANGSTIYLKHVIPTAAAGLLNGTAKAKITFSFNLSPTGTADANYKTYSETRYINLIYKKGVSSIITDSTYNVRVGGTAVTLLDLSSYQIDLSPTGGLIESFSVEEGYSLVYDDAQGLINVISGAGKVLFAIDYSISGILKIVPNSEGTYGNCNLTLKTYNGITATMNVNVYVPLVRGDSGDLYLTFADLANEGIFTHTTEQMFSAAPQQAAYSNPQILKSITAKTYISDSPIKLSLYNFYNLNDGVKKITYNDSDYVEAIITNSAYARIEKDEENDCFLLYTNGIVSASGITIQFVITGYDNNGNTIHRTQSVTLYLYHELVANDVSLNKTTIRLYDFNSVGNFSTDYQFQLRLIYNRVSSNFGEVSTSFNLVDKIITSIGGINVRSRDILSLDPITGEIEIKMYDNTVIINISHETGMSEDYIIRQILSLGADLQIEVVTTQFNKASVVKKCNVRVEYARKVEKIIVKSGVGDDGVYMDARYLNASSYKTVSFETLPANAYNGKVVAVINRDQIVRISQASLDGDGAIFGTSFRIQPILINGVAQAGVAEIYLYAQDSYSEDGIPGTLLKVIRVYIADGSLQHPFEIKAEGELLAIQTDMNNEHVYHYVLTRDINLTNLTFDGFDGDFKGNLSGKYSYTLNGVEYIRYGSINNFKSIQTKKTSDITVGLFEKISGIVSDIRMEAATISVHTTADITISAGIFAGNITGSVDNLNIDGIITVEGGSTVYVGGIAGRNSGNINTSTNAYSQVNVGIVAKQSSVNNVVYAGGVSGYNTGEIGKADEQIIEEEENSVTLISSSLVVLANISLENGGKASAVGGVVGKTENSHINNIEVRPLLRGRSNIGGVAGIAENTTINAVKVYFTNNLEIGIGASAIVGYSNLGGIAGVVKDTTIRYSYVRSFFGAEVLSANYLGNIVLLPSSGVQVVGGLVGTMTNSNEELASGATYNYIQNSYFNADINAHNSDAYSCKVYSAGLVGRIVPNGTTIIANILTISDCYVIGLHQHGEGANYYYGDLVPEQEKPSMDNEIEESDVTISDGTTELSESTPIELPADADGTSTISLTIEILKNQDRVTDLELYFSIIAEKSFNTIFGEGSSVNLFDIINMKVGQEIMLLDPNLQTIIEITDGINTYLVANREFEIGGIIYTLFSSDVIDETNVYPVINNQFTIGVTYYINELSEDYVEITDGINTYPVIDGEFKIDEVIYTLNGSEVTDGTSIYTIDNNQFTIGVTYSINKLTELDVDNIPYFIDAESGEIVYGITVTDEIIDSGELLLYKPESPTEDTFIIYLYSYAEISVTGLSQSNIYITGLEPGEVNILTSFSIISEFDKYAASDSDITIARSYVKVNNAPHFYYNVKSNVNNDNRYIYISDSYEDRNIDFSWQNYMQDGTTPNEKNNKTWAVHGSLNDGLPVLYREYPTPENMLLFVLAPSYVSVEIKDTPQLPVFDSHSHIKIEDLVTKRAVLFYNQKTIIGPDDSYENNRYYILKQGSGDSAVYSFAEYEVGNSTALPGIEIAADISITTTNTNILEISRDGENRYYVRVKGAGKAIITIASTISPTLTDVLEVEVVAGVNDVDLIDQNTGEELGASTKIYVDNSENYEFIAENIKDGVSYVANPNMGYLIKVVGSDNIIINGKQMVDDEFEAFTNTSIFSLKATVLGDFSIVAIPYIYVGDSSFTHKGEYAEIPDGCVALADLEKTYLFAVLQKAKSLNLNNQYESSFLTNSSATAVIQYETYDFTYLSEEYINNDSLVLEIWLAGKLVGLYNYGKSNISWLTPAIQNDLEARDVLRELLIITAEEESTIYNSANKTLVVTRTFVFTFDVDRYRENTYANAVKEDTYMLNNMNFTLVFTPYSNSIYSTSDAVKNSSDAENAESNIKSADRSSIIERTLPLSINTREISEIETSFYPFGESSVQEEKQDRVSPGRAGLLKVNLEPAVNNSDYITITTAESGVIFAQRVSSLSEIGVLTGGYLALPVANVLSPNGITMRPASYYVSSNGKTTLEYSDLENIKFYGVYYLSVYLSPDFAGTSLTLTITAYQFGDSGQQNAVYEQDVVLAVEPLPEIRATIDGSPLVDLASGTQREIAVEVENADENTVEFLLDSQSPLGPDYDLIILDSTDLYTTTSITKYKIPESERENFIQLIDGKYILNVPTEIEDISKSASVRAHGKTIYMKVRATKIVNGIEEEGVALIEIRIRMYLITDLILNSPAASGNTLEVKNGTLTNIAMQTEIEASTDISLAAAINEAKLALERQLSGVFTNAHKIVDSYYSKDSGGDMYSTTNNWYYYVSDGDGGYRLATLPLSNSAPFDGSFALSQNLTFVTRGEERLYSNSFAISAYNITSKEYKIIGVLKYCYDENGVPQICTNINHTYTELLLEVNVVVKDNSTYDHPNPIYSVEDLTKMQKGAHYILMKDLTLSDWEPLTNGDIASLDGNGYVITLQSFNVDTENSSNVTAGIFTTISSSTVLKNIIIDVGSMLVTDSYVNRVMSDKITSGIAIDLSGALNVTFGLLAGINNGSLTNCKIINSIYSPGDKDSYLFVYTTQKNIGTRETSATVGTLVGINGGTISTSYVGVNYDTGSTAASLIVGSAVGEVYIPNYKFSLVAGKTIGALAGENSGTITNCYANEVGMYNLCTTSTNSQTGGFVGVNTSNGSIISSFAEGEELGNTGTDDATRYRAGNNLYIESKGTIGGFVDENAGTIRDCYSTVRVKTNSAQTAGFAYINSGTITNSYSTTVPFQTDEDNSSEIKPINSEAFGVFVGKAGTQINNTGEIENCYYLILSTGKTSTGATEDTVYGEMEDPLSPATAIAVTKSTYGKEGSDEFLYEGTYNGFSFSDGESQNGIWTMTGTGPKLTSALQDEILSFRTLENEGAISSIEDVITYLENNDDNFTFSESTKIRDIATYINSNILETLAGKISSFYTDSSYTTRLTGTSLYNKVLDYLKTVRKSASIEVASAVLLIENPASATMASAITAFNGILTSHSSITYKHIVFPNSQMVEITDTGKYLIDMATTSASEADILNYYSSESAFVHSETTAKVYNYLYRVHDLGTARNPLLINNAEEFITFIINNSSLQKIKVETQNDTSGATTSRIIDEDAYVFGYSDSSPDKANLLRHVKLIKSIDFSSMTINEYYVDGYRINDIVFAGVLEGNNLSITGLGALSNQQTSTLNEYGLFKRIGLVSGPETIAEKTIISNLNIRVAQTISVYAKRSGILAGSVYNASLMNIKVEGENDNAKVDGSNLVGTLAGYIGGSSKLSNISVENIKVTAQQYNTTVASSVASSAVLRISGGYNYVDYTNFAGGKFTRFDTTKPYGDNYSYAGSIAGIIDCDNVSAITHSYPDFKNDEGYQEFSTDTANDNVMYVTVRGRIDITAENAGGMFGYVGSNTRIKLSNFILDNSVTQKIVGRNFAGGIVAENYGMLEKVTIQTAAQLSGEDQSLYAHTTTTLFGNEAGVAAGGIAGYSEGGVVINSIVRTNVSNNLFKIAGGVIGVARGYNYLHHVYTTGNVDAGNQISAGNQRIISGGIAGGIVGYSEVVRIEVSSEDYGNDTSTNKEDYYEIEGEDEDAKYYLKQMLVLDYVYALNNWEMNTSVREKIVHNMNKIYGAKASYNLIMPQVGNQEPEMTTNLASDISYILPTVYVGSVIGLLSEQTYIPNTTITRFSRISTTNILNNMWTGRESGFISGTSARKVNYLNSTIFSSDFYGNRCNSYTNFIQIYPDTSPSSVANLYYFEDVFAINMVDAGSLGRLSAVITALKDAINGLAETGPGSSFEGNTFVEIINYLGGSEEPEERTFRSLYSDSNTYTTSINAKTIIYLMDKYWANKLWTLDTTGDDEDQIAWLANFINTKAGEGSVSTESDTLTNIENFLPGRTANKFIKSTSTESTDRLNVIRSYILANPLVWCVGTSDLVKLKTILIGAGKTVPTDTSLDGWITFIVGKEISADTTYSNYKYLIKMLVSEIAGYINNVGTVYSQNAVENLLEMSSAPSYYNNIFAMWEYDDDYIDDTGKASASPEDAVESASETWKITSGNYLPEFITGIYINYTPIDSIEALRSLLSINTNGKLFVMEENSEVEETGTAEAKNTYTISGTSAYVFANTFEGSLIGRTYEVEGNEKRTKIIINASGEFIGLFKALKDASISNIDFEIRLTGAYQGTTSGTLYFARLIAEMSASSLRNVSVKIVYQDEAAQSLVIPNTVTDFGMVIGKATSSNISNINVTIENGDSEISFNNSSVVNAGLLAGSMLSCTVENVTVTGNITINNSNASELTFGGIVGSSRLSPLTRVSYTGDIKLPSGLSGGSSTGYFGGLVGNSSSSNITEGTYVGSISNTGTINYSVNVGGLAGKFLSGSIKKSSVNNGVEEKTIILTTSNSVAVGGFVGEMTGSSIIGDAASVAVNNTPITVNSSGNTTPNIYIGGIIGNGSGTTTSNSITTAINYGKIIQEGTGAENLHVGGIAGYMVGTIDSVYSTANIEFKHQSDKKYYVGGIAGYIRGSSAISNFVVYGDITIDTISVVAEEQYVGGIFGRQSGVTTISKGLSYARIFNYDASDVSSSLTHINSIGSTSNTTTINSDVYYIKEFIPYGYDGKSFVTTASLQCISYKDIDDIKDINIAGFSTNNGATFPYITALKNILQNLTGLEGSGQKLKPNSITSLSSLNITGYNILTDSTTLSSTIGSFSGLLVANDNVIIDNSSNNNLLTLFDTLDGTVANLVIRTKSQINDNDNDNDNISLLASTVGRPGKVLNCTAFGEIKSNSLVDANLNFIGTNNGMVLGCGNSLYVALPSDSEDMKMQGIASNNAGVISDSYATINIDNTHPKVTHAYGLVETNSGMLSNSYFAGVLPASEHSYIIGTNSNGGSVANCFYDSYAWGGAVNTSNSGPVFSLSGVTTEKFYEGADSLQDKLTKSRGWQFYSESASDFGHVNFGYPTIIDGYTVPTIAKLTSTTTPGVSGISTTVYGVDSIYTGSATSAAVDNYALPVFHKGQLYEVRNTKASGSNYVLMNDIGMTGFSSGLGDFGKTLYGNKKTISEWTITKDPNYGIFNTLSGKIYNLKISYISISVSGNTGIGALAGTVSGIVEDLEVSGKISVTALSSNSVGGVVGTNSISLQKIKIKEDAEISIKGLSNIGGIVGYNSGDIKIIMSSNSTELKVNGSEYVGGYIGRTNNTSQITLITSGVSVNVAVSASSGGYVGGLFGRLEGTLTTPATLTITGTVRSDSTSSTGGSYAGGFAGYSVTAISNVQNNAAITGKQYVGGITGYTSSTAAITSCFNVRAVSGTSYVGGIAGRSASTITNSYNTASVTSSATGDCYTGGISGYSTGKISGTSAGSTYNSGRVTGSGSRVGGIAGYTTAAIENCANSNTISGTSNVGGIAGYTSSTAATTSCSNASSISGTSYVGGIVGRSASTITNSYNTASVTSTSTGDCYTGGISGYSTGKISGTSAGLTYNSGSVEGKKGSRVGGIAGYTSAAIENCSNSNTISGSSRVGGIIGYGNGSITLTKVINSGEVHVYTSYAGGLAGYVSNSLNINNCESKGSVMSHISPVADDNTGWNDWIGYSLYDFGKTGGAFKGNITKPPEGKKTNLNYKKYLGMFAGSAGGLNKSGSNSIGAVIRLSSTAPDVINSVYRDNIVLDYYTIWKWEEDERSPGIYDGWITRSNYRVIYNPGLENGNTDSYSLELFNQNSLKFFKNSATTQPKEFKEYKINFD